VLSSLLGKTSANFDCISCIVLKTSSYNLSSSSLFLILSGHENNDAILTERKQKWYSLYTASDRQKYLWTQSDAFYASRKRLIECGYSNDEIDREYITGLIKDICKNKLGVKREDIGIIAAIERSFTLKGSGWMLVLKKSEN
jgi:hypothetical protein